MALTLVSQPTQVVLSPPSGPVHAAYYPAIYKLTSNQYPLAPTGSTVSAVSDVSGYTSITTSGSHGLVVGQRVKFIVSGGGSSLYNEKEAVVITVLSTTLFYTDLGYLGVIGTGTLTVYKENAGFNVRSEITINGNVVKTIDVPPDPSGVFNLDIESFVQRFITSELISLSQYVPLQMPNMRVVASVRFGEVYEVPSGGVPVSTFQGYTITTFDSQYINAVLQYGEGLGLTDRMEPYNIIPNALNNYRFMTKQPQDTPIYPGESKLLYGHLGVYVPPLGQPSNGVKAVTRSYDHLGNIQGTYIQNYPVLINGFAVSAVASNSNNVFTDSSTRYIKQSVDLFTVDFNPLDSSDDWQTSAAVSVGTFGELTYQDAIDPGAGGDALLNQVALIPGAQYYITFDIATLTAPTMVYVYTADAAGNLKTLLDARSVVGTWDFFFVADDVRLKIVFDPGGDATTTVSFSHFETFASQRFIYQQACQEFEYPVYWLNDKGGYDSLTFTGKSARELTVDRLGEFKKSLYPDNFDPSNRQFGNVTNRGRRSITVNSGPMSAEQIEWLEGLFISPDVFVFLDGQMLPVNVDTANKRFRTDYQRNQSLSFPLVFGFEVITQSN